MDSNMVMLLADLSGEALMELRGLVRTDPGKRELFRNSGGVELLLARLGKRDGDSQAYNQGHNQGHTQGQGQGVAPHAKAEILFTLAFCCDEPARSYVREAGGIDLAVQVLKTCVHSADSFECCTYAIGLLANHNYKNKMVFHKRGIVEILAGILSQQVCSSSSSRTLLNVTNVLKTLAEECQAIKESAVERGILDRLCAITKQDPLVATYTAGAIGTIVYNFPAAQTRFLDAGGCELLPDLIVATRGTAAEAPDKGQQQASNDVIRCLYATLKDLPLAPVHLLKSPSYQHIKADLHRLIALGAVDFTVKEIRNDVHTVGAIAFSSSYHGPYSGGVGVVEQGADPHGSLLVLISVEPSQAPAAAEFDLCVCVQDATKPAAAAPQNPDSRHRAEPAPLTASLLLAESTTRHVLASATGEAGNASSVVLRWNGPHPAARPIKYVLELTGGPAGGKPPGRAVVAAFANAYNEGCHKGGFSMKMMSRGQPAPPEAAYSAPASALAGEADADALRRQVADLSRQVVSLQQQQQQQQGVPNWGGGGGGGSSSSNGANRRQQQQQQSPGSGPVHCYPRPGSVAPFNSAAPSIDDVSLPTAPASGVDLLLSDNLALKNRLMQLEEQQAEQRRRYAEQEAKLQAYVDINETLEQEHSELFTSSGTLSGSTSQLRALRNDISGVTQHLQQLDVECTANELELSRFLSQITNLRQRVVSGSGFSEAMG